MERTRNQCEYPLAKPLQIDLGLSFTNQSFFACIENALSAFLAIHCDFICRSTNPDKDVLKVVQSYAGIIFSLSKVSLGVIPTACRKRSSTISVPIPTGAEGHRIAVTSICQVFTP